MAKGLRIFVPAIVILFLAASLFASPVFAQNSAQAAIDSAQSNLRSCYEAVEQAQAAGANVDSLMATLNDAASSLSQAQLAYASDENSTAINYATQSQSKLNGVTSEASILQANAINSDTQNLLVTFLSIISSVSILGVGLAAWIVLNKRDRRS